MSLYKNAFGKYEVLYKCKICPVRHKNFWLVVFHLDKAPLSHWMFVGTTVRASVIWNAKPHFSHLYIEVCVALA